MQRRLQRQRQLPRPDRAEHDPGRVDERDRDAHPDVDRRHDTVNDLDVSATRLFTNRMKLGEFNPDSTVPWLTQAQARVKGYGVYPWVSSAANNAETETPDRLALARKSGDASLVLLKNATITRKDGIDRQAAADRRCRTSGPFKVLVLGSYANNTGFYLGGYSSIQSAAGQANEVTPYAGIKSAIQAIDPDAHRSTT